MPSYRRLALVAATITLTACGIVATKPLWNNSVDNGAAGKLYASGHDRQGNTYQLYSDVAGYCTLRKVGADGALAWMQAASGVTCHNSKLVTLADGFAVYDIHEGELSRFTAEGIQQWRASTGKTSITFEGEVVVTATSRIMTVDFDDLEAEPIVIQQWAPDGTLEWAASLPPTKASLLSLEPLSLSAHPGGGVSIAVQESPERLRLWSVEGDGRVITDSLLQGKNLHLLAHDAHAVYVRDDGTMLRKMSVDDGQVAWSQDMQAVVRACGTTTDRLGCVIREGSKSTGHFLAIVSAEDGSFTRYPVTDIDTVHAIKPAGEKRWIITMNFLPPVAPLLYTTQKTYTRLKAVDETGNTLKTITLQPGTLQVYPPLFGGSNWWYTLRPEDRYLSFAVQGDSLIVSKSLVGWTTESNVAVAAYALK